MLKDFAKTSPVTFFALPLIIIGMIVLSYFLYRTLITNQIDSRQHYIERQLELTTAQLETQIIEFRKDFSYLAAIDDFGEVFDTVSNQSEKLRFRLKHVVERYNRFVDTVYIYNHEQYYFIGINHLGITQEGFGQLEDKLLPLQFINKPKTLHLEGSKMLIMSPLRIENEDKVYLGAVIDVIEMIRNEADKQYTGEFSTKVIFTENLGFRSIQRGQQFEAKFELYRQNKQEILNNILDDKAGYLLHKLPKTSIVYMTSYQPFKIFKERFGLLFVLSENDFIAPIKIKLQIIFLSFFAMIGLVIVVFIISLKNISQNNEELYQSENSLSQILTQQRFILEHGGIFSFTLDKKGAPIFVTDNIEKVTGYNKAEWFNKLPSLLTQNKINQKVDSDFNKLSNEKGFELNYNLEIKRINERNLILEFRERPYFNDSGDFEAIVGTAKDITESYIKREGLKRSLLILEAQQEAVKDAV
jgi:PAS domain S-box-containing protein